MSFKILYQDRKSDSRVGILNTKSGKIETPFFMPVATKTAVKHISSEDLKSMKAKAVICNSFILSLKPGVEVIKSLKGINNFMSFPGIIFTDSGGFQMYSPYLYIKSEEKGVIFKNPFSGEKVFITPEKAMDIQLDLDGDVAMCLDSMPLFRDSKESIEEAVRKTGLWAEICKRHHDLRQKKISLENRQLLFGITQGGIYDDLREKSARDLAKISFDGYALGGLALGEPKKDEYRMIEIVKKILSKEKPLYLMGAGDPIELLEAISRGADIFDSRYPTQNARRGSLFTWKGRLSLKSARNKDESKAIDSDCTCFVCKRYSRAYLRHLTLEEEGAGLRLVSYHNLYFLQSLMGKARTAIKKSRFLEFKEQFIRIYEKNDANVE